MRLNDFYNILEVIKQDILSNPDEYLKLLKVIGNNQRYDFLSQMSIYDKNTEATACAKFDFWRKRFNRTVKYGEKGIPIIEDYGGYRKVDYIFDISQTVSRNREVNEVNLWQFDKEKHRTILDELIQNQGFEINESLSENLYNLTRIVGREKIYELANELRIDDEDRNSFVAFISQSITYAISNRFNLDYPINKDLVANNYRHLDSISLMTIGNLVSSLTENTIERVMEKTRDLEIQEQLESNKIIRGGEDNVVRRDDNDTRETDRIWESGNDRRDSISNQGEDFEQVGRREGIHKDVSESNLRSDETGLSGGDRETKSIRDVDGNVRREQVSDTLDGDTRESNQASERRETEDDESLEDRNREFKSDARNDVSLEGDSNQGSHRSIEQVEEAEKASFFYSKDNPSVLITEEMLKRVPKLYEQDNVSLADKKVHAAYFIPFRSNWTWYMTEYDEETHDAFGLVLGIEPEWGYFNLDELRELQAQRLILEDFPKTFRELKDTELKKQLTESELNFVFDGQLSFDSPEVEQASFFDEDIFSSIQSEVEDKEIGLEIGQHAYYDHEEFVVENISSENNKFYLDLKPIRENTYYHPKLEFDSKESLFEQISLERPMFIIGDEIRYKDRDYTITHFDTSSNIKTVTIKDQDEFLGGMITGSQVLIIKDEESLKDIFKPINENFLGKEDLEVESTITQEVEAKNFVIEKEIEEEISLTPSERLDRNISALKVLKNLEKENRNALLEEQEVLAGYLGWGGLADVFDESKTGQWKEAREYLLENFSFEEYESAKESTLTSFYTPKVVVDSMYQTISDMGFSKGNILEPSMGIGNFIGSIPKELKESKFYGVELDSISGRIAEKLYPESDIQIKGIEETNFSNNFFDVAIGNVPFGDYKVNDREYNRNNFLIHDYFFAKSIDKVRNGGVIAFITSSGTMDKKDESVRRYLGARAEFLGAIRLPNNTFKGEAGTEVTSDIIFLKKRDSILERDEDWIHLAEDENGLTYNKYFVDHPEMVLGQMVETSGRFGNELHCIAGYEELSVLLERASKIISSNNRFEDIELLDDELDTIPATDDVKNFSYTIIDDDVYYRDNSVLIRKEVTDNNKEKIKDYLAVNEALKDVIYKQKEDFSDDEVKRSQAKLNEVYDYFSEKHGFINNLSNTRALKEDSNFPLVSSIEILDDEDQFKEKSDIFTKRTITKAKVIDHVETSLEALVLSVAEKGYVNLPYMESLTDKDKETLINELRGEIYLNVDEEPNLNTSFSIKIEDGDLPFSSASSDDYFKYRYVTADCLAFCPKNQHAIEDHRLSYRFSQFCNRSSA